MFLADHFLFSYSTHRASCWWIFNLYQPICSIVWQKMLDFGVIHFFKGFLSWFSVSMKLLPSSLQIVLMFPLVTINLLSAIPAGKHWFSGRPPSTSPERPLHILLNIHPGDIPIWRPEGVPIWHSKNPDTYRINFLGTYFSRSSQGVPRSSFRSSLGRC